MFGLCSDGEESDRGVFRNVFGNFCMVSLCFFFSWDFCVNRGFLCLPSFAWVSAFLQKGMSVFGGKVCWLVGKQIRERVVGIL